MTPVLLFGGPFANRIIEYPIDDLRKDRVPGYECGQVFWTHPDGSKRLIWVGRPPGQQHPIRLSLEVAVLVYRLLLGWF